MQLKKFLLNEQETNGTKVDIQAIASKHTKKSNTSKSIKRARYHTMSQE